jgi:hypothetical protein
MRSFLAVLVLAAALAACGQANQSAPMGGTVTEESAAPAEAPVAMSDMRAERDQSGGEPAPQAAPSDGAAGPTQGQSVGPAPTLYLAYTYQTGLEIPSDRLATVMDAHVQACQAAGPRLCQLIGSNRSGDPESYMEGYVSVRGEPAWLRTFMGGIAAQVEAANGRVVSQTTSTEDLTRAIVDTEARLRAQTSLRDRLQQLLQSRPGRLADLLEVERELARVQAEIDAVQSNLAVMRTRVAMSELTISYRSAPRPVGSDTFEPLRQAFANFLGIVVAGFAAIITIIAGLLPFAIVIIPIVWGLLRWRRARGGRFFGPRAKAEDKPPES